MKINSTAPFLGSFKLYWCNSCNLPLLNKKPCEICKQPPYHVAISPPGDVRPAFKNDIMRISQIIDDAFGEGSTLAIGLTQETIILLNETSYDDLMEEVIVNGEVIGIVRYNLLLEGWDFSPRIASAQKIFRNAKIVRKKFIIVDKGAVHYISDGYNVLAPGILDMDKKLRKGESAVALSPEGQVLAVGIMRINASDVPKMEKGVVLKIKYSLKDESKLSPKQNITKKSQSWLQAIQANKTSIEKNEQIALTSIRKVVQHNSSLPLSVSFSGGKDSLVCLNLALKLPYNFKVLFVNTSLEFPETVSYIEKLIEKLQLKNRFCRMDIPKDRFWLNVEKYGPPGKDYRYCCKILKIGPVNELIKQCIGKKTLSLVGQRAYESIARAKSKTLWTNPWIPNQLNFTPIQYWTALHVWLYIFKENLFYNPLYENGFSRIGCWLCPACNQATFEIIKKLNPSLWKNWEAFLIEWQRKNNFPHEWITWGLWRWQKLPKKIVDVAKEANIDLSYVKKVQHEPGDWELRFTLAEGYATCKAGEFIFEGSFNRVLNLPRLISFWDIFSETDYDINFGILRGTTKNDITVTVSADGVITASGKELKETKEVLKKLVLEVFRSEECNGCQTCFSHCLSHSLTLNESSNQIEIDNTLCTHCGECHNHCPVIKFGHREVIPLIEGEERNI